MDPPVPRRRRRSPDRDRGGAEDHDHRNARARGDDEDLDNMWQGNDFERYIEERGPLRPLDDRERDDAVRAADRYGREVYNELRKWRCEGEDPFGDRRPFLPGQLPQLLEPFLRQFSTDHEAEAHTIWGRALTRCGLVHDFDEAGDEEEQMYVILVGCRASRTDLPIIGRRCIAFIRAIQSTYADINSLKLFRSKTDDDMSARVLQQCRNAVYDVVGALIQLSGQKNMFISYASENTADIDGLREHIKQTALKSGIYFSLESNMMVRPVIMKVGDREIKTRYYVAVDDPSRDTEPLSMDSWIKRILLEDTMLEAKPYLKRFITDVSGGEWETHRHRHRHRHQHRHRHLRRSSSPPTPLAEQEDREHHLRHFHHPRCANPPD